VASGKIHVSREPTWCIGNAHVGELLPLETISNSKTAIMKRALQFVFLSCCVVALEAHAQDQEGKKREAYYRCQDAAGKKHLGTSMPTACSGHDTEVLNDRGTVLRVIEGAATHANRIETEAVQAEELRKRNEALQRDKVLIETYLSVTEIENLRDQRLDILNAQLLVAEQHITGLRERIAKLRDQAQRFKPYSDKPNAPPMPDPIAQDLIGTAKSIGVDEQTIQIKQDEKKTLTTNFEHDIRRFKELKRIK